MHYPSSKTEFDVSSEGPSGLLILLKGSSLETSNIVLSPR